MLSNVFVGAHRGTMTRCFLFAFDLFQESEGSLTECLNANKLLYSIKIVVFQ